MRFAPALGGASVEARLDGKAIEFPIRQSGAHWGPMSLCALLMMRALEVDLETALAALADFEPLAGRGAERGGPRRRRRLHPDRRELQRQPGVGGRRPRQPRSARERPGRRIVALTDMLELGSDAGAARGLAEPIEAAGIDLVFCAGPLMRLCGTRCRRLVAAPGPPDAAALAPALASRRSGAGDVVMVKGSNASRASVLMVAR